MKHIPFPFPWVIESFEGDGAELFKNHLNLMEKDGVDLKNIAAFFVESFQGWGAVFYPVDYIKAMREWCSKNDVLLVFDEIQAGFGSERKIICKSGNLE